MTDASAAAARKRDDPLRWSDIVDIALQWPETAEATSYGEPSLKVRNRLLARLRVEDDVLVLLDVPFEERDHLIEIMPDVFFCEPHYAPHRIVLTRLPQAPRDVVERLLERRWRASASKRALARFNG